MATYLSQPFQGSQYVSDIPIDLLMRALPAKQAQTDQVRGALQDQVNAIGNTQIYRDQDKQIINGALTDVIGNVNKYSGQDLTDGRVQNQISNLVAGINNNPDIYNRIAANRAANQQIKKMQEIQEQHPDQYSSINAADFMDQFENWRNDPNKISFTPMFKPYRDTSKLYKGVADDLLSHPDIRREIDQYIDPVTKQTVMRSSKEVKELTAQRVYDALSSRMNSEDYEQEMINRRQWLKTQDPGITIQGIVDSRDKALANIQDFTKRINNGEIADDNSSLGLSAIKKKVEDLTGYVQAQNEAIANVRKNGVEAYYTPNKYLSDKLHTIAQSYAYKDEGKPDYDPMYLERYKNELSKDLEQYKNGLDIKKEQAKQEAKFGATGSLVNPLLDTTLNTLVNGKGELTSDDAAYHLAGGIGDIDKDGGFNLPLSGRTVFTDIKPLYKSVDPTLDDKKAIAAQQLGGWYQKYLMSGRGSKRIENNGPGNANSGGGEYHTENKSLEEFIQDIKSHPEVAQRYKDNGIDIDDPQIVGAVNKVNRTVSDPKLISGIGTAFDPNTPGTSLAGNMRVYRKGGDNLVVGSDGQMYVNMFTNLDEDELDNRVPGWQHLRDKGIISPSGSKIVDGKEKITYAFPITVKASGDLKTKLTSYLVPYLTKKGFVDDMPRYQQQVQNTLQNYEGVKGLIGKDPTELARQAITNIQGLVGTLGTNTTDADKNRISAVLDATIKQDIAAINSGDAQSKIAAYSDINRMLNLTGDQMKQLLAGNNQPTVQLKDAIGQHESGGNYNATNSDSSAYGKYQFIKDTRKHYYDTNFSDRFPSFSAFDDAFKNSPALQEEVMQAHVSELQRKYSDPTLQILAHYMGEGSVDNYIKTGKLLYKGNPISLDTKINGKESPREYVRDVASKSGIKITI